MIDDFPFQSHKMKEKRDTRTIIKDGHCSTKRNIQSSLVLIAMVVVANLYIANVKADGNIPDAFRQKYRFLRKEFYTVRTVGEPVDRKCHSFDFSSDPKEDEFFEFCEGTIGDHDHPIECNLAKMDKIKIRGEDNMFCTRFFVKGDARHMWCSTFEGTNECGMATFCDGEPILSMYQSQVESTYHLATRDTPLQMTPPLCVSLSSWKTDGMCGRIPGAYLDQFRFIDNENDDYCYSFTFDGEQPKENETINLSDNSFDICTGGDKTCTPASSFRVNCIHSTIEDDLANNWTCVGMGMNGNDNQYYLWLREGDFLQALLSDDSDHACATNKAPGDSALNANQSMQCPVLQLANEFNFNPETFDDANRSCVSFDLTNSMGIDANTRDFRWCISNETVKAQCRQAAITSLNIIPKDDQTDKDEFWFCVEFQGYKTKKFDDGKDSLITRYLAVDGEGGAAAFIDTRQFNSCDDLDHPYYIPNQQTDLTTGRCRSSKWEDVTDNGITRFLDFDGIWHYFNNSYNPTGGGSEGRLMYSQFRYCTNGIENWAGSYNDFPALRQCDSSATYQYIKHFHHVDGYSNYVCVKFNAANSISEKEHLWVDYRSSEQHKAVLAADCETPPKDFRWTRYIYNDGYYEVLPETFTGYAMRNRNLPFKSSAQHFRVGNDFCHSFQFDPLILTHDQAYTDVLPRDDKDLFYYCKGTGGVRNCTTNVTRDLGGEVESFFASIQNFEVTIVSGRVWYCVEFDVTFYAGDSWKHYLWLHEGIETAGVGENRAYISTSSDYSCDTNNPTNVWSSSNPLRADGAHCPAIPDDAIGKLRWNQGSENHWFSADLQGNPGRRSGGNEDNFNICEFSGHCYEADLNLVNYTDGNFDEVCLSVSYTSTYGLSKSRAIIIGGGGDEAVLANDCFGSGLQNIYDGLVHRLTGELQKKLAFWQKGTCVSFDFSDAPHEETEQLNYCESVRYSNWCTSDAKLKSVTNPDYEPQNWYCVTLSYKNRRGLDETRYVWLNPHYFGWDNGAGIMKESCSSFPFEIDPGSLGNSENYLLRDGECSDII